MESPVPYLFKVGRSRTRNRRRLSLAVPEEVEGPTETDLELKAALAEQARKHVAETFDLGVMLAEYEKVYDVL